MGRKQYPWLPVVQLSRYQFSTISYIRNVSCPLLVIHSPDDDFVPFEFGRLLFAAGNEPKEFLEITGPHNDGFLTSGRLYFDGLDTYIGKYFGDKRKKTEN